MRRTTQGPSTAFGLRLTSVGMTRIEGVVVCAGARVRALFVARLRLTGEGEALAVDCLENRVAAATEQCRTYFVTQSLRIVTVTRLAQNDGTVGVSDDGFEMQAAIVHGCGSANRNLAASSQPV